jgi:hypothetical protein
MQSKEVGTELSILERFEAEEKKIRRESGDIDREMKAKIKGKEKELDAARADRVKEEADLARMKAGYFEQLSRAEAEEETREKAEAAGRTEEDYRAGRIDLNSYLQKGVPPDRIAQKARAEAPLRLSGLVAEIRDKASKIIDLEIEERTIELDIFFLTCFPAQNEITRLKAMIKELEAGFLEVLHEQPTVHSRLDHLKTIKSGRMTGHHWYDLDEAGVKDLLFDPMLPSRCVEKLNEIILEISGTGKRYQISWAANQKGVSFMQE